MTETQITPVRVDYYFITGTKNRYRITQNFGSNDVEIYVKDPTNKDALLYITTGYINNEKEAAHVLKLFLSK